MLAEKFFLSLETLISHLADAGAARYPDGSPKVLSSARFVPVRLAGPFGSLQPGAVAPELRSCASAAASGQAPALSPLLEQTLNDIRDMLVER